MQSVLLREVVVHLLYCGYFWVWAERWSNYCIIFHGIEEFLSFSQVLFTLRRNFPWFWGFFGEKYERIISFLTFLTKKMKIWSVFGLFSSFWSNLFVFYRIFDHFGGIFSHSVVFFIILVGYCATWSGFRLFYLFDYGIRYSLSFWGYLVFFKLKNREYWGNYKGKLDI